MQQTAVTKCRVRLCVLAPSCSLTVEDVLILTQTLTYSGDLLLAVIKTVHK